MYESEIVVAGLLVFIILLGVLLSRRIEQCKKLQLENTLLKKQIKLNTLNEELKILKEDEPKTN